MDTSDFSTQHSNPYNDSAGWWSALFARNFNWRWSESPHLYYEPSLEYTPGERYLTVDGMGREKEYERTFDCTINPLSAKLEKLYVQAPDSICHLPNATWERTVIRDVAPLFLRLANLPFNSIPRHRRNDVSKYTSEDWTAVASWWIPSVVALFFTVSAVCQPPTPQRKQ